jgi:hypothetical protein
MKRGIVECKYSRIKKLLGRSKYNIKLQWKPLNVISVNVISYLLFSDFLGSICWTLQKVTV